MKLRVIVFGAHGPHRTESSIVRAALKANLEVMRRGSRVGLVRAREDGREVFYAECNPGLPGSVSAGNGAGGSLEDAAAAGGTLVLDAFERVFDLPRDDRRAQLDRLFALLERPGARLTTVFVTDTSHLTNVFTLAAHAPGLLGAVFELKSIR